MFPNYNSRLRTRSRTGYNPHHLLLKLTTTLNTRLPKSSTLNSTSAVNVNFSIWYDGRAMKGQTRKWIGWSLLNSLTPPSWLQISIVRILPGPVLLVPSVFRLKNTLFNYYTIKRNYMKGQKIRLL